MSNGMAQLGFEPHTRRAVRVPTERARTASWCVQQPNAALYDFIDFMTSCIARLRSVGLSPRLLLDSRRAAQRELYRRMLRCG